MYVLPLDVELNSTLQFFVDKPSPPQNLKVVGVQKTSVTLAWETPAQDGGSRITGYIIEKSDAKRLNFTTVQEVDASTHEFKVTRLFEGSDYLFKVSAVNSAGQSEPASIDEPVTAKLPFGEFSDKCLVELLDIHVWLRLKTVQI